MMCLCRDVLAHANLVILDPRIAGPKYYNTVRHYLSHRRTATAAPSRLHGLRPVPPADLLCICWFDSTRVCSVRAPSWSSRYEASPIYSTASLSSLCIPLSDSLYSCSTSSISGLFLSVVFLVRQYKEVQKKVQILCKNKMTQTNCRANFP